MSAHLQSLVDKRNQTFHAIKTLLDDCARDGRSRSAEEQADYERMNTEMDDLGRQIQEYQDLQRWESESEAAREILAPLITPDQDHARSVAQATAFERFLRTGDSTGLTVRDGGVVVDYSGAARLSQAVRSGMDPVEARALLTDTGSTGSLVPTTFVRELYAYMEASSAIRRLARVITTSGGENMDFPRVGTHSIGTQVIAQGTAIGGTQPVFEKMTLGAYKYGELVQISTEAVQDAAFDVVGFLAENVGRALGRITDTAYVTGNGTSAPNGIVTAAGTGVKTGGTLITLTIENLIDLQHSVVPEYRQDAWFVMNDYTAGTLRKIREDGGTSGAFLWQPAVVAGDPDRLLGSPVASDVNFASQGSAARSVAYGDFSAYYIRDAGGARFERSDEYAFNTDLVSFRGVVRTDADLIDANAVKTSSQSV